MQRFLIALFFSLVTFAAQAQQVSCNSHGFYDASDNGSKTLVAGVAGKKIRVCGYALGVGGTATNLTLTSGTGTDCVTTSVAITPAWQLIANQIISIQRGYADGLATINSADNLCIKASAGNAHQVEYWYTVE